MLSQWLNDAISISGISQAELARRLTDSLGRSIDRAAVNKMAKGKRGIAADEMMQIAKLTNVPVPDEAGTAPLVGYVGAGAHFFPFEFSGDLDRVPAPDGSTDQTVAAEIRGESLGVIFDRWLVFYDDVHGRPTEEDLGKLCVLGLPDGTTMVKQLKPGQLFGKFNLFSNTEAPIYDAEVEWCAVVRHMSPR